MDVDVKTRKTSLEIDEQLVEQVRRILGTTTLRETVEGALLEVVREHARREEVRVLSTMDGMELDNSEVMTGAWRA